MKISQIRLLDTPIRLSRVIPSATESYREMGEWALEAGGFGGVIIEFLEVPFI